MFPWSNPSRDLNINFPLRIATLLKASEKDVLKFDILQSKRELNLFGTPGEASKVVSPKGRHPMIGTNNFIHPIAEQKSSIVRGYGNFFQRRKSTVEVPNIWHLALIFREYLKKDDVPIAALGFLEHLGNVGGIIL